MWITHFAGSAVQRHQRNGSADILVGTPQALGKRSDIERYPVDVTMLARPITTGLESDSNESRYSDE